MCAKKLTKKEMYLQELSALVADTYPLNMVKLNKLLDEYFKIKQKYSKRVAGKWGESFIWQLLKWHTENYADTVKVDESQLVYISRFMDYKRRIIDMLVDTHRLYVNTPFVSYDRQIVNYLRQQWEQTYPELDKENRLLYAAVQAYKVGIDIPITSVYAELPFIEKVAVDKGKLEDVYGVYLNGCIGVKHNEFNRKRKNVKAKAT